MHTLCAANADEVRLHSSKQRADHKTSEGTMCLPPNKGRDHAMSTRSDLVGSVKIWSDLI